MATVIDLRSSSSISVGPPAARLDRSQVRPLPVVVVVVVVVLLFASVRVMQRGGGADTAAIRSSAVTAVEPIAVAGVEVGASGVVVVVEVEHGDTFWSIASELQPGEDPRSLVVAMVEANGGSAIQIGQEIVIPVRLLGEQTALR